MLFVTAWGPLATTQNTCSQISCEIIRSGRRVITVWSQSGHNVVLDGYRPNCDYFVRIEVATKIVETIDFGCKEIAGDHGLTGPTWSHTGHKRLQSFSKQPSPFKHTTPLPTEHNPLPA